MIGNPLLESPQPDFTGLVRVLSGAEAPRKVYFVEHFLDPEVLAAVAGRYLGKPWIPLAEGNERAHYELIIELYSRLGYDSLTLFHRWHNHPEALRRRGEDTAGLARGERVWVEEGRGLIASREDLDRFPWDTIVVDPSHVALATSLLPPGMKITVAGELFEHVLEVLLGYEGLFYLLHDDRALVEEVFARWGQKTLDFYEAVIGYEGVGGIFQSDDLGFKTATMLSLRDLRQLVLPWFKKYAALAHAHGKVFWLHSCGNLYGGVTEDLIDDVRLDALHSFQDIILPVEQFKAHYGHRIATLGGVDVDDLARLDEASLRRRVRQILGLCQPGGRFALGSGSTVTNYVPLSNYLAMLDEGRRWGV
ncbi:MAG: uroporphyrinogen decarboxylase family protein [Anaerolineae bacterium]